MPIAILIIWITLTLGLSICPYLYLSWKEENTSNPESRKELENRIRNINVSSENPEVGMVYGSPYTRKTYVYTNNGWFSHYDGIFCEIPNTGDTLRELIDYVKSHEETPQKKQGYCIHCGAPVDPRYPNCPYCDCYY